MFLDDRLKLLRMSRDIKLSPQDTEGKCTLYASGKPILFLRVVEGEGVTFDLSVPSEILEHLDPPAPDPGMWRICCQAQERAKRRASIHGHDHHRSYVLRADTTKQSPTYAEV